MSDLDFIHKLKSDDAVYNLTGSTKYYISLERNRKWIEEKMFNNKDQIYLMICNVETDEAIGYVCATNIDYINRKAEWGGIVLGSDHQVKGYGLDAGRLLLNHLFGELGMNMVYCFIKEGNLGSVKLGEKIGFEICGFIQDYIYKNFQYHGVHMMKLLKSDYIEKNANILSEKELIL